jgi:hypothetical protein
VSAPERIWIEGAVSDEVWKHDKQSCLSPHEYTRTDLIAAMIDEAVQAEREACAVMLDAAVKHLVLKNFTFELVALALREMAECIRARKGGEA